ncbi:MAG: phosphoribosylformylglycinamidine synthase subunit PurL, partial [Thermoplasmata archaeon]
LYMGDVSSKNYRSLLSPLYVFDGVVSGIRDYGNRIGIPNVAGSVFFDASYNGNPLVNAGCVGIVEKSRVVRSKSAAAGNTLVIVGGRTGRDGIHGVNFASRKLGKITKSSKMAIQLGNPIIEQPMIKAVVEANDMGILKAMKDLGGGGLSSAVSEMVFAGGFGTEVNLDGLYLKDSNMSAWEIWISESQERMLIEVEPKDVDRLKEVMDKWGLEMSILGKVIEDKRLIVNYKGKRVIDLDIEFMDDAPQYQRPYRLREVTEKIYSIPKEPEDYGRFLESFLSSLNACARFNVVRQYDHTVRGQTVLPPFVGEPGNETHSDATIIKPIEDSYRGLVITSGSKPLFVSVDPYNGTIETLTEAYKNILSSGGKPNSIVDALNFGNPEREDVMGQFEESVRALGDFARYFHLPVVAGNVSLYNEFGKKDIMPTPTIMMIGLIDDIRRMNTTCFKQENDPIYIIGKPCENLSGSEYLHFLGKEGHYIDSPDMDELERIGNFLSKTADYIKAAHDVSTGGVISALSEMAFGSDYGFELDLGGYSNARPSVKMFSECGNMMIIEVDAKRESEFISQLHGIRAYRAGYVRGSSAIVRENALEIINVDIKRLKKGWETGLNNYI